MENKKFEFTVALLHVEYLNLIPFSSYRPRKNQLLEDDDNLIVDRRKEPL